MPRLLELDADGNAALVDDRFHWVGEADTDLAELPDEAVIVPFALFQREGEALLAREGELGVWLDAHEAPDGLADHLAALAVIGIHFPVFTDGRGLSTAALLRSRFDYRGRLLAHGDVQRDQLSYMRRCGFDAFRIRPDLDAEQAIAGLRVMTRYYQGDMLDPRPMFRRERASDASAAASTTSSESDAA